MSDATTVDNGATSASRARFIPLAVIALLALGYGGYRLYEAHQPYEWSGTVEARTITVGSRAGGRVKEVLVREGDRVKAGQPLLVLEPGDLEAQQLQAQGAARSGAGHARQAREGRAARGDRAGQGARADGDRRRCSRRAPARGRSRSAAARAPAPAQRRPSRRRSSTRERIAQARSRAAPRRAPSSTTPRPRCAGGAGAARRAQAVARRARARLARRGGASRRRRARPKRSADAKLVQAGSRVEDIKAARGAVEAAQGQARSAINAMIDELTIKRAARLRASSRSTCGPATSSRRTRRRRRCSRTTSSTCASTCPRRSIGHISVGAEGADHRRLVPGQDVQGRGRAHQRRRRVLAAQPADRRRARRPGVRRRASACTRARTSCAPAWRRSSRCRSEPRSEHAIDRSSDVTRKFGDFVALDDVSLDGAARAWSTACSARTARARSTLIRILCGLLAPTQGTAPRARPRRRHAGRGDPPADRLHEPEVRALRGSRPSSRTSTSTRASTACRARGSRARVDAAIDAHAHRAVRRPARRAALGRLEAAARARRRAHARAARRVPRRADRRHRSGRAARAVGPALQARRARASRCSSPRTTWTRPSAAARSATSTCRSCSSPARPTSSRRCPAVNPPGTRRVEVETPRHRARARVAARAAVLPRRDHLRAGGARRASTRTLTDDAIARSHARRRLSRRDRARDRAVARGRVRRRSPSRRQRRATGKAA